MKAPTKNALQNGVFSQRFSQKVLPHSGKCFSQTTDLTLKRPLFKVWSRDPTSYPSDKDGCFASRKSWVRIPHMTTFHVWSFFVTVQFSSKQMGF